MPRPFFTETSGWFIRSEAPASSGSRSCFPGHSGGGGADNSHATEDLSFPSTVHEFRGRVCGGGGGGGVVFLVNLGSPQFLVPFRIVISTFKTLGNNQRLAFHFRETGLWVNCTFYFRTD